jgi:glyoxylase-like metal-dependent hydrolase (beta-lactamase superfamily II)/rhodanese-related sulfurtransferase
MFFRQLLHDDLGCASYLVGSRGRAAVVDPKWEIDEYLEIAAAQRLRIEHVLETHNHADHLSGRGRLIAATGATAYISAAADVGYEHVPLHDGDELELGDVRIRALATPGHRPEHMAFLVGDAERSDRPWSLLAGDSLFIGDSARPDLAVEARAGARGLFATFARLRELDDFVEVWPGHIGGSLCGGTAMSQKPSSTLGYERHANPYLALDDEEEFVARLTASRRPQPPNFQRIVELNRGPLLTEAARVDGLSPVRTGELLEAGATLIDVRDPYEFDAAHVPGSLCVTANRAGVGTRAAWMVDPDSDVVLLAPDEGEALRAARCLEAVGFRALRGYVRGGIEAWRADGGPLAGIPALDPGDLAERLREDAVLLLDVRDADEWQAGHVPGSLHVPYYELRDGPPPQLERAERPVAVACSGGFRSALAASVLAARGLERVEHVASGGIADLPAHGIELIR